MPDAELKSNGTVWESFSSDGAKNFLRSKDCGKDHPARLFVRDWIASRYPVNSKKKQTLLDIPCGSGVDFELLSPLVEYYGADRTPAILEAFEANTGCEAVAADIRNLPFAQKSFDIVYARAIFEHLPDIENVEMAINECVCVTKQVCIFSFFIPLGETERIDWNGEFFNNRYARADVEKILDGLGKWTKHHIDVTGTDFLDSYDIYILTL